MRSEGLSSESQYYLLIREQASLKNLYWSFFALVPQEDKAQSLLFAVIHRKRMEGAEIPAKKRKTRVKR